MAGDFATFQANLTSPITGGTTITISSSPTYSAGAVRAVWVGGAGDLSVVTVDGSTVLLVGVTAGSLIPAIITKLNGSSTVTNVSVVW